jgi:hypothetical protein
MSYPVQAPDPAAVQPAMADTAPFGAATPRRLRRPGARPIVFSGSELAMVMSFTPELPYWYELNIYRTDAQGFVLAIQQFFQSETEEDRCQAWEFESLVEVFDALESYDAAKDVKIPMDANASTPAEMMAMALELRAQVAAARANFDGLLGELFAELDAAMPGA